MFEYKTRSNTIHFTLACGSVSRSWITLDVLDLLLEREPIAVTKHENGTGLLPLHCACLGSNLSAIPLLISPYPTGVRVRDIRGKLPLHCASLGALEVAPVRQLLELFPEGATISGDSGRLPLHYDREGYAAIEVLEVLLQYHPGGIHYRDSVYADWHFAVASGLQQDQQHRPHLLTGRN